MHLPSVFVCVCVCVYISTDVWCCFKLNSKWKFHWIWTEWDAVKAIWITYQTKSHKLLRLMHQQIKIQSQNYDYDTYHMLHVYGMINIFITFDWFDLSVLDGKLLYVDRYRFEFIVFTLGLEILNKHRDKNIRVWKAVDPIISAILSIFFSVF